MKRLLKAACLLMCFLFCATAFAANVTGVSILEYGLYTYDEKVIVVEDKQGSTKLSNIRLIKQTLDIPLRENTFFSIKYILESPKPNQDVDIELRVTNPGGETNTGTVTTPHRPADHYQYRIHGKRTHLVSIFCRYFLTATCCCRVTSTS